MISKTVDPVKFRMKGNIPSLTEGVDYYIENGSYVFTGHFLWKRGFCCENRCRHCPYGLSPEEDRR